MDIPDFVDTLLVVTHLTDLLSESIHRKRILTVFVRSSLVSTVFSSRTVHTERTSSQPHHWALRRWVALMCKTIHCGHCKPQVADAARPRQMTEFGPTRVDSHLTKRSLCANSSPVHSNDFFPPTSWQSVSWCRCIKCVTDVIRHTLFLKVLVPILVSEYLLVNLRV